MAENGNPAPGFISRARSWKCGRVAQINPVVSCRARGPEIPRRFWKTAQISAGKTRAVTGRSAAAPSTRPPPPAKTPGGAREGNSIGFGGWLPQPPTALGGGQVDVRHQSVGRPPVRAVDVGRYLEFLLVPSAGHAVAAPDREQPPAVVCLPKLRAAGSFQQWPGSHPGCGRGRGVDPPPPTISST